MNYEDWRNTFQSSEEAALSAYNDAFRHWSRAHSLEAQLFECRRELAELKRVMEEAEKREPDGWQHVPIVPTQDMINAAEGCWCMMNPNAKGYWEAMLSAAPKMEDKQ